MDYNTLLSQGIRPEDYSHFELLEDQDDTFYFIKLKANQRKCIYCSCNNTKIKEYKSKTVRSLPTGKNRTTIVYSLPRYFCPNCKKTYTHSIDKYASNSVSKILKTKLLNKFSEICTFKSIAKEYDLSLTEVINIFDESCPDLRVPFSEAICIDEFSNIRKDEYKFACVIIDFYSHKIIDILPSRTTPFLDNYFEKIPLNVREKVKYVVTDMYDGYISAIKRWFKNATIAIDPFHYMKYLTEAVQSVRRRILSNEDRKFNDRSWMGSHWRLLTTNPKNYPEKNMTLKSGMTISYSDRVLNFVKQDKELLYAYLTIQGIYASLERLTFEKAHSYFDYIINLLKNSILPEFRECAKTWENYKEYIINSFITYKGRRLSNGPIEGTNKRVKELKIVMSGYRNHDRFYKRLILIQNSNKKG